MALQFELVVPERLLFSEPVEMVVVPGCEGDFGVLLNHAPMVSAMRPGVLSIYQHGQVLDRLFVTSGFAEVTGSTLTVLAEKALLVDSLNRVDIEQQLSRAKEALLTSETPQKRAEAERKIVVTEAMLTAMRT